MMKQTEQQDIGGLWNHDMENSIVRSVGTSIQAGFPSSMIM